MGQGGLSPLSPAQSAPYPLAGQGPGSPSPANPAPRWETALHYPSRASLLSMQLSEQGRCEALPCQSPGQPHCHGGQRDRDSGAQVTQGHGHGETAQQLGEAQAPPQAAAAAHQGQRVKVRVRLCPSMGHSLLGSGCQRITASKPAASLGPGKAPPACMLQGCRASSCAWGMAGGSVCLGCPRNSWGDKGTGSLSKPEKKKQLSSERQHQAPSQPGPGNGELGSCLPSDQRPAAGLAPSRPPETAGVSFLGAAGPRTTPGAASRDRAAQVPGRKTRAVPSRAQCTGLSWSHVPAPRPVQQGLLVAGLCGWRRQRRPR